MMGSRLNRTWATVREFVLPNHRWLCGDRRRNFVEEVFDEHYRMLLLGRFELGIPRAIYLAHAGRADQSDDFVGSELGSGSHAHLFNGTRRRSSSPKFSRNVKRNGF
jgi:hypothetical protein